jgi:hypothetical protein
MAVALSRIRDVTANDRGIVLPKNSAATSPIFRRDEQICEIIALNNAFVSLAHPLPYRPIGRLFSNPSSLAE